MPPALSTATRRDLALVLLLTLAAFVLAGMVELHEAISRWTSRWEFWQIDEVPTAVTVLALGLAWFAFRRRAEAAAALRLQAQAQADALRLLEHNRELARQLIAVQENERLALARELHDELGQRCNAIRVEAAYIQRCDDAQQIGAAAARAAASAEALYQHVRTLLRQLRPAELDELGLPAALQALCEQWEARSGVACIFLHETPDETADPTLDPSFDPTFDPTFDESAATALYRVAQEGLSNVMRHAQATRVRIALQGTAVGELHLRVEDDGCGFDPQKHSRGLGLLGASERAAALGGELQVESRPGAGTRLQMRLPARAERAAADTVAASRSASAAAAP
jgi:two-component system sensor histidine kinase UhpB